MDGKQLGEFLPLSPPWPFPLRTQITMTATIITRTAATTGTTRFKLAMKIFIGSSSLPPPFTSGSSRAGAMVPGTKNFSVRSVQPPLAPATRRRYVRRTRTYHQSLSVSRIRTRPQRSRRCCEPWRANDTSSQDLDPILRNYHLAWHCSRPGSIPADAWRMRNTRL